MSRTPSPTSSQSPKTSATAVNTSAVSVPKVPEVSDVPIRVSRPSIAFAGTAAGASTDGRRSSIQFAPALDLSTSRPNVPSLKLQRRMSSPPPPSPSAEPLVASMQELTLDRSTYESRVSFDTFDNKEATDISFTLVSKHKDYAYTRRSRTFLCGTDQNDYSEFALEWLVEELVEDGDEIVCLRVVDKDSKIASDPSVQQGIYKEEARSLLDSVKKKNEDGKAISLVLELAMGKVPETIQRMIQIYAPTCLIVGTRGRSLGGISGLLPGSVSKYCLQNSPVPVVVVRPEDKRSKKKAKRLANSGRQVYSTNSLFSDSNPFRSEGPNSGRGLASEGEAQAVAKAIGLNEKALGNREGAGEPEVTENPLSRSTSVRSEAATDDSPSPEGPLVMDEEGLEDVPEMELEAEGSPVLSECRGEVGGEEEDLGREGVDELKSGKNQMQGGEVGKEMGPPIHNREDEEQREEEAEAKEAPSV